MLFGDQVPGSALVQTAGPLDVTGDVIVYSNSLELADRFGVKFVGVSF